MITTLDSVLLVASGIVAGLVGSAGGITTLVSYPVLLAVGLPTLSASVANNVALVGCWPGSALGSKLELNGQGPWLRRFSFVALVGGGAGAALLLSTPPGVFARVVPLLVLAGSLALLFEPRLTAWRERRRAQGGRFALPGLLLALSLYNGYFGAGAGVMILTLMLVMVDNHLPTANALKNMLVGAAQLSSAAIFVIFGSVNWSAAIPLGVGMLVGSRAGPVVTRRIPRDVLRLLVVALGIGLAVYLWFRAGS